MLHPTAPPVTQYINGSAKIPSTFTGPLGKIYGNEYQSLNPVEFNTDSASLDRLNLTAGEMEDLSGDHSLLLKYAEGNFRAENQPYIYCLEDWVST